MKRIYILLLPCLLWGCGIYGRYTRPENITAEHIYGESVQEQADSTSLASLPWRELFRDTCLQQLLDTALLRNVDYQQMLYTVEQAQAVYKASKLAYVPGFSFAPSVGYDYNISSAAGKFSYSVPVAMDWEIDIFGKLLNQKRKAQAALLMTQDMQQAVQTQVVANVATLYYQLLMLDAQYELTVRTADRWEEVVRVMQAMKQAGMLDEISVSQTQATLCAVQASLITIKRNIADTENALCCLLCWTPQTIRRGTIADTHLPESLSVGVSAQLLSNRPDVRQAEHNLQQYFYNENYARSCFYPSISISASALWNGQFLTSALGSLVQPIFQNYALVQNLKVAKAQYQQAYLAFRQSLVSAAAEVNNALRKATTARQKQLLREQQITALQRAMEYTESSMNNGSTTYLEVIYTQQALLNAETEQLSDWLEEATGIVSLYQALGGGAL